MNFYCFLLVIVHLYIVVGLLVLKQSKYYRYLDIHVGRNSFTLYYSHHQIIGLVIQSLAPSVHMSKCF